MITISRLHVRDIRAIEDFDLRIPLRGRYLIDAAAGMGKTSIILGLRLALTGSVPQLAAADIIRSAKESAQVELELSDGRDRIQIQRKFSATGQSANAIAMQGLGRVRAEGPDQVQALLNDFFAYPPTQVAEFFLWGTPLKDPGSPLAADRSYLQKAASKLAGDQEMERAIASARGAVKRSHDSKRHRELVARRLRLRREWANQSLAVIAPELRAARNEADGAREELARLRRQLTEVETLGKLGGRSGQIYAAAGQIIEQSVILDRACQRLRLLHDIATEPDGGESELMKVRARVGRLRSAHEALSEALTMEAQSTGEMNDAGSTGAVLSRLVDLRSEGAVLESARRSYARWSELTEQIEAAAPARVASRFALENPAAEDPVRLSADLRILERDMTAQGIEIPDSLARARQLASGEASKEDIADLEQLLRAPPAASEPAPKSELRERAAAARERAATMLFGLDLPTEMPQVERSLTTAESEIARLEEIANNPPALVAHTQELEAEIVRIRALLEQGREQLCQLAPHEGLADYELDLDRIAALRKSVLADAEERDLVEIAPNPALERRLGHARRRTAQLETRVSKLEAGASEAAGIIDKELEAALVEARDHRPDDSRKRQLESEIERLESELSHVDDSLRAVGDDDIDLLAEADTAQVERNLTRLQQRQRVRAKLAAALRGMDSQLGNQTAMRTLQNARNMLPQFSGGQFFDLRLTADGSIELWDESARSWVGAAQCGSAIHEQTSLLLWLARAVTHSTPDLLGVPGFCVLDDPGAMTTARLSQVLAETFVENPLLDSIPQIVVLSERPAFAEAGFTRLHSLGPT